MTTETTTTTQLSSDYAGQSLSSGTMRPEDLYESFIGVLENHDLEAAIALKDDYSDCFMADEDGDLYLDPDAELVSEFINALFDALDEIAPEGCYFGSHPGDGADYGFWFSEDDGF